MQIQVRERVADHADHTASTRKRDVDRARSNKAPALKGLDHEVRIDHPSERVKFSVLRNDGYSFDPACWPGRCATCSLP